MEEKHESAEAVAKREKSRMQGGAKLLEGSAGGFTPASQYKPRLETGPLAAEESDSEAPATSGIPKLPNGVPARLCVEKGHPDFDECYTRIGVKFNGIERKGDVYAYDVAGGFIRVHIRDNKGRWKQSRGRFVTVKLNGVVEPYWR